jgi:hypothetical protein
MHMWSSHIEFEPAYNLFRILDVSSIDEMALGWYLVNLF